MTSAQIGVANFSNTGARERERERDCVFLPWKLAVTKTNRSFVLLRQAPKLKNSPHPLDPIRPASNHPATPSQLRVPRAMRDLGTKMAELKFEAPLAKFEETDEWGGCDFISNQNALNDTLNLNLSSNRNQKDSNAKQQQQQDKLRLLEDAVRDAHISKNGAVAGGASPGSGVGAEAGGNISPNCNTQNLTELGLIDAPAAGQDKRGGDNVDNFTETFGGSLEDLVNTFDEKITKCFGNYEENVEELAPVQVRSQEEIMNECQ